MKFANNQSNFSLFAFLVGQLIFSSISVKAIESDDNQALREIIYLRSFDPANIINGILSHNWIKNHDCLIELNAIKTGLENHEEWAIRGKQHFNLRFM